MYSVANRLELCRPFSATQRHCKRALALAAGCKLRRLQQSVHAMAPASDAEWPAPASAMRQAQAFIQAAAKRGKVALAPDRDADGLCSGAILHHTLTALGCKSISVHFLPKGENLHTPAATAALQQLGVQSLIVLDQGSRSSSALLPGIATLVVDHHQSTVFPDEAQVLSAYGHEPVATTSLLAYLCCRDLHDATLPPRIDWLAVMGTFGDLGSSVKWKPPLPDMADVIKQNGKQKLTQAVSLINAPRRTAECNMAAVWEAVLHASGPVDLLDTSRPEVAAMQAARDEVNAQVNRWARSPPRFSADGRVALITIDSGAQVHPVIASRWCSSLKGKSLRFVMVANTGFLPNRVNFAARIAKHRASPEESLDLIAAFKDYAQQEPGLTEQLGENFARGHAQASGGSVSTAAYELLLHAMGFNKDGTTAGSPASKAASKKRKAPADCAKDNGSTLMTFGFKKGKAAAKDRKTGSSTP